MSFPIPLFVAFEGIDASGKETQSKNYFQWVDQETYHPVPRPKYFSFPRYDTKIGGLIDGHLHKKWRTDGLTSTEEHLMFQCLNLADKAEAGVEIKRLVANGHTVVTDRYDKSAEVYGMIDGLDPNWLRTTQSLFPKPDIQFLLHITVEESIRRRPRNTESDRYERDLENMKKRADLYFNLWTDNQDPSLVVIDGMKSPEEVQRECREATILYFRKVGAL